ncbi:pentapeptide repeat-containing protein [Microbispora sp. NBC_01389]|uniref:pentapeptide repeat-containing protein n=1 Tax=Microbispora sp. NBC_01389 TaxID=2903584 RepID=UPI003243C85B
MDTISTVRGTHITLPCLEVGDLTEVGSLDGDKVIEFSYGPARLRELSLAGTHLIDGRVTGLTTQRATWRGTRLHTVEFSGCDLSGLDWSGSTLTRVVFIDCKLMGAALDGLVLEDVLFERCRLDYATLIRLRTSGPVIVSDCSLREATVTACDLTRAAFTGCDLHQTTFDGGTYRGCDLRGNDLSGVRGATSLTKVTIDRSQMPGLAQAVAAELGVVFGEDLNES